MKWVLFVCVENKARSQIAEALFNKLAQDRGLPWRALSAGTRPGLKVYEETKQVIEEEGIEFSGKPKVLTEEMVKKASLIITMGCGAESACPALFVSSEDWNLPDPEGKSLEEFRKLKEEIRFRVEALLGKLGQVN